MLGRKRNHFNKTGIWVLIKIRCETPYEETYTARKFEYNGKIRLWSCVDIPGLWEYFGGFIGIYWQEVLVLLTGQFIVLAVINFETYDHRLWDWLELISLGNYPVKIFRAALNEQIL